MKILHFCLLDKRQKCSILFYYRCVVSSGSLNGKAIGLVRSLLWRFESVPEQPTKYAPVFQMVEGWFVHCPDVSVRVRPGANKNNGGILYVS